MRWFRRRGAARDYVLPCAELTAVSKRRQAFAYNDAVCDAGRAVRGVVEAGAMAGGRGGVGCASRGNDALSR